MNRVKNVVLRVLLISMMTVAIPSAVFAGGEVKVKPAEKSKAVISLNELDAQSVTLSIESDDESVIYYSKFIGNTDDYSKMFDFSKLEDGNYVIIVDAAGDLIRKPLSIRNSEVILKKAKSVTQPVFRMKDNTLLVFHNNQERDEYLISFYGNEGKFFTDEIEDMNIAKRYDLSQLPTGSYSVSVQDSDDFYTYRFQIK